MTTKARLHSIFCSSLCLVAFGIGYAVWDSPGMGVGAIVGCLIGDLWLLKMGR